MGNFDRKIKNLWVTMYIKNRRNSNKIKAFGSYQILCLIESFVLRNRLLFIYLTLHTMAPTELKAI
jgi:hypothetical protein